MNLDTGRDSKDGASVASESGSRKFCDAKLFVTESLTPSQFEIVSDSEEVEFYEKNNQQGIGKFGRARDC